MFDYILTGPISGVSAGLYLVGLINEVLAYFHSSVQFPVNATAAFFAILVTLYFWWENIKGIPESSEKALKIMYITTVMVVLMIGWCLYTISVRGAHLPPWPHLSNLVYSDDALGWLKNTSLPYTIGLIGILIGLGHSVLAMSGEETMAQVYREIEHPKLKNLEKAGFLIFAYSLIFTAGVAFFAVMIIPDSVRTGFQDNPIGGLAMYLVGPVPLRIAFRGFIAVVGTLMLAGAVNTSIVGSNGVLNRVSEDGILPQWFRHPHRRFGTSHRILNLVVGLQILTILFFAIFSITERTTRKRSTEHAELDQFNLEASDDLTPEKLGVRPGNVLVMVRNYNTLHNLNAVLNRVDPHKQDVVALHLRFLHRSGGGEYELTHDQLFSLEEQKLFTRALEIAEKKGKTIHLAVAAATDRWDAILRAAQSLQSSAVALGASNKTPVVEDARLAGLAWERLPDPKPQLAVQFYFPSGQDQIVYLGPHAPHLTPKEIDLLHGIWLELSNEVAPDEIHHHDVVHFALEELQRDMSNSKRREVIGNLRQHLYKIRNRRVPVLGARRE